MPANAILEMPESRTSVSDVQEQATEISNLASLPTRFQVSNRGVGKRHLGASAFSDNPRHPKKLSRFSSIKADTIGLYWAVFSQISLYKRTSTMPLGVFER